jgi:hypothetical protein
LPEVAGSSAVEQINSSGKSMGGDVLLGRAAACAKKKGSDEGTGGSFWIDRWEDKRWGEARPVAM